MENIRQQDIPPGTLAISDNSMSRHPYSVVLFDEIEKAHPDVFNMMLQILEDGHLTDAKGKKVNFKNTVIIMTSNIGSDMIMQMGRTGDFGFDDTAAKASPKKQEEKMKQKIMEALRDHFRPEFLNRIDEIITFHPLNEKQIREIVELQLAQVIKRLEAKKIELKISNKAKDWLGKKGYDPNLGARPLRRLIQTELLDKLAMEIIAGNITDGSKVEVDVKNDKLTIK
jgi:ATP-dependent Clp protease ATP-binding subunit ClpA